MSHGGQSDTAHEWVSAPYANITFCKSRHLAPLALLQHDDTSLAAHHLSGTRLSGLLLSKSVTRLCKLQVIILHSV